MKTSRGALLDHMDRLGGGPGRYSKHGIERPPSRARRIAAVVGYVALGLLVLLCLVLFFSERWLFATWSSLQLEEILYHLRMSFEGTNTDMIWQYLARYGTLELLGTAGFMAGVVASRKLRRAHSAVVVAAAVFSLALAGFALWDVDQRLGVLSYAQSVMELDAQEPADERELPEGSKVLTGDFIGDNYVNPRDVDVTFPAKKRNVIYIYLESMEDTFADFASGGGFERNTIPELTALAQENECFAGGSGQLNGGLSLSGTTWTAGALFGQSTGVPLKVPISGNNMGNEGSFFEGLDAFGDILAKQGYRQVFLLGSDIAFGGRDLFFEEHGDFEIRDYYWALETGLIPPEYFVFWGYEDSYLFEAAKQTLTELAAGDEPFNLTMLTVDTHFEDGYLCDRCDPGEFEGNQYANVMHCSSRQTAEFVAWVQQQDFYEDTTIVINGDHCTMDVDFCNDVPGDYERRTYTCIVNSAVDPADPARRRSYSTLDMFPTSLAAMGVRIEGDRLGLGTNLFGEVDTLVEEYGAQDLDAKLEKPSNFLNEYSEVKIDARHVKAMGLGCYITPHVDETGHLFFTLLDPGGWVNLSLIEDIRLEIADMRDGRTYVESGYIEQYNPNKYGGRIDTDLLPEDLPYLEGVGYIKVTGFDEVAVGALSYEIAEADVPMEQ